MNEVYIVSMARTAIGAFNGALSGVPVTELGSIVVKEAVKRAGIDPAQVNELYMGNVVSANAGQAPAKQVALGAGLPDLTPTTQVNKVCASGMKAIMVAAQSIMLGDNDVVVAGGMENMSRIPHYIPQSRTGYRYGNGVLVDGILRDALEDPYRKYPMGCTAELCAKEYKVSREAQDEYAVESYKRAEKAQAAGIFAKEIVPVEIPQRKGDPVVVDTDEEIARVRYDKIGSLRPAFEKDGTVTAANASKINDGAAAVVLMSKKKAEELGVKPLAKIASFADASQSPDWFTTTPAKAMPKAIEKAGLTQADIDYYEINEAFSVVSLVNIDLMGLDAAKVNVNGGAVSLGHPVGVSGARIVMSLISVLEEKGGKYGCAGICNGGGGASAMVIEKL